MLRKTKACKCLPLGGRAKLAVQAAHREFQLLVYTYDNSIIANTNMYTHVYENMCIKQAQQKNQNHLPKVRIVLLLQFWFLHHVNEPHFTARLSVWK